MSLRVIAVLPFACAWARWQESMVLKTGVPLSAAQTDTAKRLGILSPERVGLRVAAKVPPLNTVFRHIGKRLGIVSDETIGMTLRYGIFIHEDHWGDRRL